MRASGSRRLFHLQQRQADAERAGIVAHSQVDGADQIGDSEFEREKSIGADQVGGTIAVISARSAI
jgi:hypothetical protein